MLARLSSGVVSRFLFLFDRTFAIILIGLADDEIVLLILFYNYVIINFIGYAFVINEIVTIIRLSRFWDHWSKLLSIYAHKVEQCSKVLFTYMIVMIFFIENKYFVSKWNDHLLYHVNETHAMRLELREQPTISRVLFENALSFHLVVFFIGFLFKVRLIVFNY